MVELSDFYAMFEKNPLAHILMDANYNLELVNDAFCKLCGYSRDRLMETKFTDFREKGMIKYIKDSGDSLSDAIRERRIVVGQSTLDTPNGLRVVIRNYIPLYNGQGTLEHIYVTYNDITPIVKSRDYMAKEIDEFIKVYDQMAHGDLTVRSTLEKPSDPDLMENYEFLVRLRGSIRKIIEALQTNIRDVNTRMQNLTTNSEVAQTSIEDASTGLNQIAASTTKVSENAEKSSHGINQITKAMQDMSAVVEEICSSMESVSTLAKDTNDLSKKGANQAGQVEKSMGEISVSAGKVYEIVSDVEKQMAEISKIVILIRELANQTNLLALNAAIEAARAGDAGRGFAVVATEVKSLAQESRNSAEKIEEMIGRLKESTRNASTAMSVAKQSVDDGAVLVTETVRSFNLIASSVEKVTHSAAEVAAATEEQAATTQDIATNVSDVTNLVEMTAKEAGDAAAATEELNAALEEITSMVHLVNKTAKEAMDANKHFKVE
jgi:methyl-accepting chemotaxis protein